MYQIKNLEFLFISSIHLFSSISILHLPNLVDFVYQNQGSLILEGLNSLNVFILKFMTSFYQSISIETKFGYYMFSTTILIFLIMKILLDFAEIFIVDWLPLWGWGLRGRGAYIYRQTGNEDFQYGISRFCEKYGRKTVFSTLDGAGNYWKKYNGISIFGHLFLQNLFCFNTCKVFGTLSRLLNSQNITL